MMKLTSLLQLVPTSYNNLLKLVKLTTGDRHVAFLEEKYVVGVLITCVIIAMFWL